MTAPATITHTLNLPFATPPLNANDRMHWRPKAAITKQIRDTVRILAIAAHLPRGLDHITVTLHYAPRDNRIRDAINLTPTQKVCVDGLVDFGIVPNDHGEFVTDLMPVIHPKTGTGQGQLWLTITWEEAA